MVPHSEIWEKQITVFGISVNDPIVFSKTEIMEWEGGKELDDC